MARPGSQATAGYFPTPEHLLPEIAALVDVRADGCRHPLILDPCAGTGTTVLTLAERLFGAEPDDAPHHCRAIELEATRARSLRQRIPDALHSDALHVGLGASPGATVLYLNPPYDRDAEHGRLEQRFLARFTGALAPGGVLLFVVPYTSLAASADYVAAHYSAVSVVRFPDEDFGFRQVVLVARRRQEPIPPDRFTARRLVNAAASVEGLPLLGHPMAPVRVEADVDSGLSFHPYPLDLECLLSRCRPFSSSATLMGFDRDCRHRLGAAIEVALPPRPPHIALAVSAGLLNGRIVEPNDPLRFPRLLVKGTYTRALQPIGVRRNKDGDFVGQVCVQQPRLDLHVLRLDDFSFHRLTLGTEPSGADSIERCNSADFFEHYSASLAELVREQLPAVHDPEDPAQQFELPRLARRPFRVQAAAIRAALKLLAQGRNPQAMAEVGTGKSTVTLSVAAALRPEHFHHTVAELARIGCEARRLRPVQRMLVVCPPHLLDTWKTETRAVVPEARVQIVERPSDLERPAWVYVLSREAAKLGSTIAGIATRRCPDCGHPLPEADRRQLATKRMRCEVEVTVPGDELAVIARDVGLAGYRWLPQSALERVLLYFEPHPAVHRLVERRTRREEPAVPWPSEPPPGLGSAFVRLLRRVEWDLLERSPWEKGAWAAFAAAGQLALVLNRLSELEGFARSLIHRRAGQANARIARALENEIVGRLSSLSVTASDLAAEPDVDAARSRHLGAALGELLDASSWRTRPGCGGALHWTTPEPRRVPLARVIARKHRHRFDLLVLDEAHEFAGRGSAQEKAAHRLVELPGVPTLALSGSMMGGYSSSLFANTWSLSRRLREEFEHDEQHLFVARFGYRRFLVSDPSQRNLAPRSFGRRTDRDENAPQIRQLGEAPGVLPSFVLRHLLPDAVIMQKSDLDEELPSLSEEPIPIVPEAGDELGRAIVKEYARLRDALVAQIQEDRGSDRAGLLWGAMSQLPSYLDLASEECGEFVLAYPKDAGGEVIARGRAFPAGWKTPKERWLLCEIDRELAAGRRVLLFVRHTGTRAFVDRLGRLIFEATGHAPRFLDANRVNTKVRERWLDRVVAEGCRVLLAHPQTVQTGLNNLTAFSTAIWYEGPEFDARVVRQANGRPHRIGQTESVRIVYPVYAETLQATALELVAKKVSASEQVDGLSLAGALEAAGAMSEEDRLNIDAALAFGEALYRAAVRGV